MSELVHSSSSPEPQSQDSIWLESSDGVRFELSRNDITVSHVLDSLIPEDLDVSEHIPLPNVHSVTLHRIVEFMKYHALEPMRTIPQPIPWPKRIPDVVSPVYYCHFILTCTHSELMLMLAASDYLHIQPLIELCCARLARLLINKTPAEIICIMSPTYQDQEQEQEQEHGQGEGEDAQSSPGSAIPVHPSLTLTAEEILQLLDAFRWTAGGADADELSVTGVSSNTEDEAEPGELLEAMGELRREFLEQLAGQVVR